MWGKKTVCIKKKLTRPLIGESLILGREQERVPSSLGRGRHHLLVLRPNPNLLRSLILGRSDQRRRRSTRHRLRTTTREQLRLAVNGTNSFKQRSFPSHESASIPVHCMTHQFKKARSNGTSTWARKSNLGKEYVKAERGSKNERTRFRRETGDACTDCHRGSRRERNTRHHHHLRILSDSPQVAPISMLFGSGLEFETHHFNSDWASTRMLDFETQVGVNSLFTKGW